MKDVSGVEKEKSIYGLPADEYLRLNPANKKAIDEAIAQVENGK